MLNKNLFKIKSMIKKISMHKDTVFAGIITSMVITFGIKIAITEISGLIKICNDKKNT